MDGHGLVERVQAENRTAISRLSSEKALLAATEATLTAEAVVSVIATTEGVLQDVFVDWAERADSQTVAQAFDDAATSAGAHDETLRERVHPQGDGTGIAQCPPVDDQVEAVGAYLVGNSLVLDGLLLNGINFFINEADERGADTVREIRAAVDDRLDAGTATLTDCCSTDADWDRAAAAAVTVIDDAYDEYVRRLEAMGIDPKPVC